MDPHSHESNVPFPAATDEEALQTWMERYGDVVLRTATLLLRDRHLAEDISQETFLTAYQKRSQLADPAKSRSWLLQIAVNLCRSRMRKAAWTRLVFTDVIDGAVGRLQKAVSGPEETVPLEISVVQLIERLPYSDREVLVLHYYHSLSVEEISAALCKPVGTIKSRLSRARAKARGS